MDETYLHEMIDKVIEELNNMNELSKEGYYAKHNGLFNSELKNAVKMIVERWSKEKHKDVFIDFDHYLSKLIIAYDRYAPSLYRILLPADSTKPQSCPLYGITKQFIYYKAGSKFNEIRPDEVLSRTLTEILIPKLGIINFREESKLETWVHIIIINIINMEIRKQKKPNVVYDDQVVSPIANHIINQPDQLVINSEFVIECLKLLNNMIAVGERKNAKDCRNPQKERAWLLWNDYLIDYFVILKEDNISGFFKTPASPFPLPPEDLVIGRQGAHNLDYTNYLAREIGKLRSWSGDEICKDLEKPHTPQDLSKLRQAVRTRRNEAKTILRRELKNF